MNHPSQGYSIHRHQKNNRSRIMEKVKVRDKTPNFHPWTSRTWKHLQQGCHLQCRLTSTLLNSKIAEHLKDSRIPMISLTLVTACHLELCDHSTGWVRIMWYKTNMWKVELYWIRNLWLLWIARSRILVL